MREMCWTITNVRKPSPALPLLPLTLCRRFTLVSLSSPSPDNDPTSPHPSPLTVQPPSKRITSADHSFHPEIGHEKAQSVIDSITSSYAAEGQASSNPLLGPPQGAGGPPPPLGGGPGGFPPPPFGFPGGMPPPMPGFNGQVPPGGFPRTSELFATSHPFTRPSPSPTPHLASTYHLWHVR